MALEKANQGLADLMAMLSHDLRTPLTVISGTADVLSASWDGFDDATKKHMVSRVGAAGRSLDELLTETLTMSALDGEGLKPWPGEIPLAELVTDVLHTSFADVAVSVEDLDAVTVWADRQHLTQILSNLLSNALKYGAEPVSIRSRTDDRDVEITVRDSGTGVPPEFVPRLFERYARADEALAAGKRGTGLGLYIVHGLVSANRGTIGYRDARPHGSEFVVTLPRPLPPDDASQERHSGGAAPRR